jgi:hypothetical protein
MNTENNPLVIREYPFSLWFFGLVAVLGGGYLYFHDPSQYIFPLMIACIGVLFILMASILTVTIDQVSNMMTIHHRNPLWGSKKEIPIGEIASIQVERSSGSSRGQPTYRIAVICKDGQSIPFHSYFSSGLADKMRKAGRLCNFLGVGGTDQDLAGLFKLGTQMAQQQFQKQQEAMTGSTGEEHITDGVHWQLQTFAFGGTPLTRWFSPDFKMPGTFLFLAQKAQGQKNLTEGLLGSVGKMLHQQVMNLYGYGEEDTPNKEFADTLSPLDPKIESYFSAFTSDPEMTRQVLNPWAILPLADWAARYPLKQFQQNAFSQLTVLFSPRGVYLSSIGTMIPEQVEELTRLGVELVKSQGAIR